MPNERRASNRRKFGYYMPVVDNSTREVIGYLSDISSRGFKLESPKNISINNVYHLRLDLTAEVSKRSNITLFAKVVWSQPDPINPYDYVHGFQIVSITPEDQMIYDHIAQKYGVAEGK